MVILHCIEKKKWEEVKHFDSFGKEQIELEGFIHCSPVEYFWRVAADFRSIEEELVLLCIETEKVNAIIKWEDGDNCGRAYPHVYGEINMNAVIDVLEYRKDNEGNYIKNPEFKNYPDR